VTGREELFSLFSDALRHLDHLATGDASDTHAVDLVVRKVMGKLEMLMIASVSAYQGILEETDEEAFEIRNRERVEQDKGLKEFICESL